MPTTVTVDFTGVSPFYVYLCDTSLPQTCVYMCEIDPTAPPFPTLPYTFNVPPPVDSLTTYVVKIIDGNGCIKTQTVTV